MLSSRLKRSARRPPPNASSRSPHSTADITIAAMIPAIADQRGAVAAREAAGQQPDAEGHGGGARRDDERRGGDDVQGSLTGVPPRPAAAASPSAGSPGSGFA